jgi:hypothetical protein
MPTAPLLSRTAQGHLSLDMEDDPGNLWPSLLERLRTLGASGVDHDHMGSTVDASIGPHFRLGDVQLKSGWDNWSGYYLMADSAAGDALLQELYAWLRAQPV